VFSSVVVSAAGPLGACTDRAAHQNQLAHCAVWLTAMPKLSKAAAKERAERLRPIFTELADRSAHQIARILNEHKIATPTGRPWSATTVIRIRQRLAQP
jgi:selenocysteine lyase/cysteine desulfurase